MTLTANERRFLTALLWEQQQAGCRGPAHDLLRQHVYPKAPRSGPGSLAFAYEAVPLTGLLLKDFTDLQQLDEFLRNRESVANVAWPWSSVAEYLVRLHEARAEWTSPREAAALP